MINMCRFNELFFTWYGQKHLLYTLVKVCMRASIPFCLLVSCVVQSAVAQELVYSYAEAKEHLLRASNVLKVAAAEEQIARKEQEKASSLWWPHIQADGMYAHLSERCLCLVFDVVPYKHLSALQSLDDSLSFCPCLIYRERSRIFVNTYRNLES